MESTISTDESGSEMEAVVSNPVVTTPTPSNATLAVILGVSGITSLIGGILLYGTASVAVISRLVAEGRIVSLTMTDQQLINAVYLLQQGTGIMLVGLAVVLFGLVGLFIRRMQSATR